MRPHPLQKVLLGKSIDLSADGLYEDRLRIDTDYYMRVDMKDMTMNDLLVYAQHKIDHVRHKLAQVTKELSVYDSKESILKEVKRFERSNKRRQKKWKDSSVGMVDKEYDVEFEYQYVPFAQEWLQQINERFSDALTNNWLIDSIRDLMKKYDFVARDVSYGLSMQQMCKERLNDLDNRSSIVDLCRIYDIVSDITNVFEYFKPYNVSYGSIQVDVGGLYFWVCDQDTYKDLSPKKQQQLRDQSYLIECDFSPVQNMRYAIYLYIPRYIEHTQKNPRYIMSPEEEELRHTISYKAICDLI